MSVLETLYVFNERFLHSFPLLTGHLNHYHITITHKRDVPKALCIHLISFPSPWLTPLSTFYRPHSSGSLVRTSFYFLPSSLLRLLSPILFLLSNVLTSQAPQALSSFCRPQSLGFFVLASFSFLPPSLLWLLSPIFVLASFSFQTSSLLRLQSPILFLLSNVLTP